MLYKQLRQTLCLLSALHRASRCFVVTFYERKVKQSKGRIEQLEIQMMALQWQQAPDSRNNSDPHQKPAFMSQCPAASAATADNTTMFIFPRTSEDTGDTVRVTEACWNVYGIIRRKSCVFWLKSTFPTTTMPPNAICT